MKTLLKTRYFLLYTALLIAVCIAGCDGGGGPTGPANAPILDQNTLTATPPQASSGSIIVFSVNFVDIPGDLNGGTATITDSQGNNYQGVVSDATGTAGTLITSIQLSPLVTPGTLRFDIFVTDLAGNVSNTVFVSITVTS